MRAARTRSNRPRPTGHVTRLTLSHVLSLCMWSASSYSVAVASCYRHIAAGTWVIAIRTGNDGADAVPVEQHARESGYCGPADRGDIEHAVCHASPPAKGSSRN